MRRIFSDPGPDLDLFSVGACGYGSMSVRPIYVGSDLPIPFHDLRVGETTDGSFSDTEDPVGRFYTVQEGGSA